MRFAVLAVRNVKEEVGQLVVEYSNDKKIYRQDTGVRVLASRWDMKAQKIKKEGSANPKQDTADATLKKDTLNALIRALHNTFNRQPTVAEVKEAIAAAAAPKLTDAENVLTLIDNFISEKEVLKPAEKTIVNYKQLRNTVERYLTETKQVWNVRTLSNEMLTAFQVWMRDKENYQNSTLKKRVTILKQMLSTVHPSILKADIRLFKPLHNLSSVTPIVLTQTELSLLIGLNLSLNKSLDKVRDLFVVQCLTGLRHSDLIRLDSSCFSDGFIKMKTKKTDSETNIPVFDELRPFLDKYTVEGELVLPTLSQQKFNNYIKKVCKLVPELHKNVVTEEYRGKQVEKIKQSKYEVITTHTARRTFITHCLEKGFSERVVMKFSTHTDFKSFSKYVRIDELMKQELKRITGK